MKKQKMRQQGRNKVQTTMTAMTPQPLVQHLMPLLSLIMKMKTVTRLLW